MAKQKKRKSEGVRIDTSNCSHSLNYSGDVCCFCFATVGFGEGAGFIERTPYAPPSYPDPTPPPFLSPEQIEHWQRGIDHARQMTEDSKK